MVAPGGVSYLKILTSPFFSFIVRSRSLLTYEGPHLLEEQHLLDHSGGQDRYLDASKHSALSLESVTRAQHDQITEITIANETGLEKSVLMGLQQHR